MNIIITAYGQPNKIECDCDMGWCGRCEKGLCYTLCLGKEDGKPACEVCGTVYPQFFRRLEDIPVYFADSFYKKN